ncbi:MAG: NUDIX hydrolase [Oscillospiraceae bacterium]|nr:NUDIX hydrolase [Oscillospiraceae bacterium]
MSSERRDARGLTEAEAIARYRSRNYPKPALTADIVVLAKQQDELYVLLVKRGGHPYIGQLALPGGFANENEPVEQTAARELEEETGVSGIPMELVGIFSRPGRDPRGWVVSAAFAALADSEKLNVQAGDDAASAGWYRIEQDAEALKLWHRDEKTDAKELAFDHEEILKAALQKLGLNK